MNKKNFAIFLKPDDNTNLADVLSIIFGWSQSHSIQLHFDVKEKKRVQKLFDELPSNVLFSTSSKLYQTDIILSLGGDGTLLGTCRSISTQSPPPIFAINMGRLGFITEFTQGQFLEALENCLSNDFSTYQLPLFNISIIENETIVETKTFINDAVINRSSISRMLNLNVETQGEKIFSLEGDGLIISSPIGSTAYSLSAGGPIVHPKVSALVLTAICPHTLSSRPIVIPCQFSLKINAPHSDFPLSLTLDGQENIELSNTQSIQITQCDKRIITLIKNKDRTYFGTLREKFTHGGREY